MSIREVSSETLKRTILRVIRSSAAQTINFSYRTQWNDEIMRGARVTFHGYSLERVARAIERGQIRVGFLTRREARDADGAYYPNVNQLRISRDVWHSPERDSTILHEAVHAAQDMGFLLLSRMDAELTAFLVEVVYQLRTRGTAFPWLMEFRYAATLAANIHEIDESEIYWLYKSIETIYNDGGIKMRIGCGREWCYPIYDFDGVGGRGRR